jgi:DnaJ like chaperone protein
MIRWLGKGFGLSAGASAGGWLGAALGLLVGHAIDQGITHWRTYRRWAERQQDHQRIAVYQNALHILAYLIQRAPTAERKAYCQQVLTTLAITPPTNRPFCSDQAVPDLTTAALVQIMHACPVLSLSEREQLLQLAVQALQQLDEVEIHEALVLKHFSLALQIAPDRAQVITSPLWADSTQTTAPAAPAQIAPTLAQDYALLGVEATDPDPVIDYAYRRLLSRHHPDKLFGSQSSAADIQTATTLTHAVRRAYERIRQARQRR